MALRRMIWMLLAAGAVLALTAAVPADNADGQERDAAGRARSASKELMMTVRGMLARALAQGGAAGAIHVCADSAQAVGQRLEKDHGLSIRRVSERWRNPGDIPDAFEGAELRRFAERIAAGVSPDSLEALRVVAEDTVRALRYMKPIVIGEMCLSCHGDPASMKPPVAEAIRARYPEDRAVGYRAGELRGAVSVRVELKR